MSNEEYYQSDLNTLSQLIHQQKIKSEEITEYCLSKINDLGKDLNAFVSVDDINALTRAKELDKMAEANQFLGPLHGIPIAIKDNYLTDGLPTTAGSKVQIDTSTLPEAPTVSQLKKQGAIIIGKTNMHEWAYGATNELSAYGAVKNPWNLDHISAGSSGGSAAAVAARLVPAALGSDTGGSIRMPASACGISGLKPTYGLINKEGVLPLSWSMDVAGPMARNAKDLALLLGVMTGDAFGNSSKIDFKFGSSNSFSSLEVAKLNGKRINFSDEIASAYEQALAVFERYGAIIRDVDINDADIGFASWDAILHAEASTYHEDLLNEYAEDYFSGTRIHLEMGKHVAATDYLKAQQFRSIFIDQFFELFSAHQVIAIPTLPVVTPKIGDKTVELGGEAISTQDSMTYLAWIANFTGLPAISIPCGFSESGLPIGLSLIGPPQSDAWLLHLGDAFQQVTEWHEEKPR